MEEDLKDNYSSHSIDFVQRRPNQNLEIIEEENNSINHDLNKQEIIESKTQANFYYNYTPLAGGNLFGKRNKSTEKMKRSALLHEKVKEILNYRQNLNNLEADDDTEIKIEDSNQKKKKVEKKVNRNKKLLNLIKERMNKNEKNEEQTDEIKKEEIKGKEEEKINENTFDEDKIDFSNETPKNDENNRRNKYKKREGVVTFNKEKKDFDENSESKNNENEKREKLLKIFDNPRFNKFRKRDIEKGKKEQEILSKENNENNENESGNKSINSITKNVGSVSYPTFMKKGSGTFQISTPKSKLSHNKNEESGKDLNEESKKQSTNKKEEKFTEVPSEQRNKLTINIKPKNINMMDDSPNNSSKVSNKDEASNQKVKDNNDSQNKENKDKNIILNIYNMIENNETIKTNDLSDKKENKIGEISNSTIKEEEKFKTSRKENHKNNTSNISSNNKNKSNNASSKKGAMKILELLKAKKMEQRDSILRAKSQDKP